LAVKKRYKTYISVLLLALYAFIATPVQLWHHHVYAASSASSNSKEETSVTKSPAKKFDTNCKICSHHYSVAANDAVTVYFPPVTFCNTVIDPYLLNKIANPVYGQSNKGPPAIA
jgi:hypothetical protein